MHRGSRLLRPAVLLAAAGLFAVLAAREGPVLPGRPSVEQDMQPDETATSGSGRQPPPRRQTRASLQGQAARLDTRGQPAFSVAFPRDMPTVGDLEPTAAWDGQRPTSLAEAPRTPALERNLASLRPQVREIADYKLGLLSRLESCLAGRLTTQGDVMLAFRFRVDRSSQLGEGDEIEVRDSSLAEEDDAPFLECARRAHQGQLMRMVEMPGGEYFYWNTAIHIPLAEDRVYRSLLSDNAGDVSPVASARQR